VRNPYFGAEMLSCGSSTARYAPASDGAR
jgi:hypothetical protein